MIYASFRITHSNYYQIISVVYWHAEIMEKVKNYFNYVEVLVFC